MVEQLPSVPEVQLPFPVTHTHIHIHKGGWRGVNAGENNKLSMDDAGMIGAVVEPNPP